jgi:hypothetical protein
LAAISNLAFCFRQRFTHFSSEYSGKIVLMPHHQFEPSAQQVGANFCRFGVPVKKGFLSSIDSSACLQGATLSDSSNQLTCRRIIYLEGFAAIGIDPLSINKCLVPQQDDVVQIQRG